MRPLGARRGPPTKEQWSTAGGYLGRHTLTRGAATQAKIRTKPHLTVGANIKGKEKKKKNERKREGGRWGDGK